MNFRESLRFSHLQTRGALFLILPVLCVLAGFYIWKRMPASAPTFAPPPASFLQENTSSNPLIDSRLDINLADSASLDALPGIGPVLSARILKFRNKKGGFRSVSELQKVYGLSSQTYELLKDSLFVAENSLRLVYGAKAPSTYPFLAKASIDINRATASELKQLPGIGKVLSKRIVKFREARAGFRAKEDIKAVYGLSKETFERILPYLRLSISSAVEKEISPTLTRIDLNTAGKEALMALPGIGSKLADRMLKYKELVGFYYEIDQLKSVYGLSKENFERMQPYLFVEKRDGHAKKSLLQATDRQLLYLPHIDKPLSRSIIRLIRAKRKPLSWEDLEALPDMTKDAMKALRAYYTLD